MYLLIRTPQTRLLFRQSYLHSTMYLLILLSCHIITTFLCDLHSTMYLLILLIEADNNNLIANLHSTMYLLIPVMLLK